MALHKFKLPSLADKLQGLTNDKLKETIADVKSTTPEKVVKVKKVKHGK